MPILFFADHSKKFAAKEPSGSERVVFIYRHGNCAFDLFHDIDRKMNN